MAHWYYQAQTAVTARRHAGEITTHLGSHTWFLVSVGFFHVHGCLNSILAGQQYPQVRLTPQWLMVPFMHGADQGRFLYCHIPCSSPRSRERPLLGACLVQAELPVPGKPTASFGTSPSWPLWLQHSQAERNKMTYHLCWPQKLFSLIY